MIPTGVSFLLHHFPILSDSRQWREAITAAPSIIPRVKQRTRALDMVAATRRAGAIMDQAEPERIAALLDDFNAAIAPA